MDYGFLYGQWPILYTNFPLWLKGDKTAPSLNYAPTPNPRILADTVRYTQGGQAKIIEGYNHTDGKGLEFVWRGRGLLALLKSPWKIEYLSPELDWMILSFERTWFTPAGFDIVSKGQPSAAQRRAMQAQFEQRFPQHPLKPLP